MARRKKSGTAGDLLEIVALLPWWGGVALAVVSYLGLNHVATQPAVAPFQPGQVAELMTQSVFKAFAMVGQYALPLLCLLGAVTSAWRRSQRQRLVADVTSNPASDALEGMSWREFETLVGEGFRRNGFRVMETGGGGPDGGVDLVLRKPGKNGDEKYLVQCKQWRAYKVGVDVVRELYGVMAASGAAGGFVVTSGRFTDEAARFASGRNVTLVDGVKLKALLRQTQATGEHSSDPKTVATEAQTVAPSVQAHACPLCSKPMARRAAKRGANAGNEFWGCTDYPTCRGTRPIH